MESLRQSEENKKEWVEIQTPQDQIFAVPNRIMGGRNA
jgi:hypothetical protein